MTYTYTVDESGRMDGESHSPVATDPLCSYKSINRVEALGLSRYSFPTYHEILSCRTNQSYLPTVPQIERNNRRFVFVGARSAPLALTKSCLVALQGQPDKISVKVSSSCLDEEVFLEDMFKRWGFYYPKTLWQVYHHSHETPSSQWEVDLDRCTDIVIYGGQETVDYYKRKYPEKNLIIHGPKFSFGVITDEGMSRRNDLVTRDFTFTQGEGCLSPKFYFILNTYGEGGGYREDSAICRGLSFMQKDEHRSAYQSMLSLGERSRIAQSGWSPVEVVLDDEVDGLPQLYGGVKLFWNRDRTMRDVHQFIYQHKGKISTVAVDRSIAHELLPLQDVMEVPRMCPPGMMQQPEWEEQYDEQYDFESFQ